MIIVTLIIAVLFTKTFANIVGRVHLYDKHYNKKYFHD